MNLTFLFRHLTVFLLILSLSSCVYLPSYPESWPNQIIDDTNDCEFIMGIYNDLSHDGGRFSVNFPGSHEKFISYIQLSKNTNSDLEIKGFDKDKEVFKYTYSKIDHEYLCESGNIEIQFSGMLSPENGMLAYDSGTLFLSKDAEKSLVFRKKSATVGLFTIIPIGGYTQFWVRYPEYKLTP